MISGPGFYLTPLNPAVAFGAIIQQIFHGNTAGLKTIYVFLPFPLVGGVLAVLFHEYIYKKVQEDIRESEDHENNAIDKNDPEDVLGIQTGESHHEWNKPIILVYRYLSTIDRMKAMRTLFNICFVK